MLKMSEKTVMHSYPGMVALVTVNTKQSINIMAAGWHSYISYDPPIYGVAVAEERFTHRLIKEADAFAINFLPAAFTHVIQYAGTASGAELNKFNALQLPYFLSDKTGMPILADAYVAYDCQVRDINRYGDHDWIVGDIVRFYRDDQCFTAEGLPDWERLNIPLYLGRSQYIIANQGTTRQDERDVTFKLQAIQEKKG